jgi:hypothetical protein
VIAGAVSLTAGGQMRSDAHEVAAVRFPAWTATNHWSAGPCSTRLKRPSATCGCWTGHRHWSGLRDEAAALGYLRTAVVNGSRSVLRRRKTARGYVPPHQANARSAESLAMLTTEHQAVVTALGQLPPRQR